MRMLGFVLAGGLAITMSAASAQQDNDPPAPEADQAEAQAPADTLPVLYGEKAFGGWEEAQPGQERLIRPSDLPAPMATESASNPPATAARRDGDAPVAPANFSVNLFAEGLEEPRTIRVAPDGTIFVVESRAGRIRCRGRGRGDGADRPPPVRLEVTLPWHWVGLEGQWRRVAQFDYDNPIIAAWGPWVIVSLVGGAFLLVSALLFVFNLLALHFSAKKVGSVLSSFYARAVHQPARVPAAFNGFGIWNVLVLVLMIVAYGYPIAQFFINPPPGAVVHRVDGGR